MRKTILGRRGLIWALAAMMVVILPGTRSTWAAMDGAGHLINSEMPPGVTLRTAKLDQTINAVSASVAAHPEMATSIVQAAIMTRSKKYNMDCPTVQRITQAAIMAAKDRASAIIQMALSLMPDCADSLNQVLADDGVNTYNAPQDLYGGFGVGFGPGFPGSPGFTGSPPSGAIALPPVATTNTTNG